MGVIQRQSLKYSVVSYVGVFIGIISSLFIYPLDTKIVGVGTFIVTTGALILSPIMIFGYNAVVVRYFPILKSKNGNVKGLFLFLLKRVTIGVIAISLIFWSFKSKLIQEFPKLEDSNFDYFVHINIIGVLVAYYSFITAYVSNYKRIVFPAIFNLFIKASMPILVYLYYIDVIGDAYFVYGLVLNYVFVLTAMLIYASVLGFLDLIQVDDLFNKKEKKEINTYSRYSVFSTIGSLAAFRIDTIMITLFLGFNSNGIYTILASLAAMIVIPTQAIVSISSPILSENINKGNMEEVDNIYRKSSINLMVLGLLVYILMLTSIDQVFELMKNGETMALYYNVIVFLGLTKIVDLATSVNSQIILYSKYFRFNNVTLVILAVLNILFNWYLIPIYGIDGAAMATLLSMITYNLVKLIFIQAKFNIQPFSKRTIYIIVIAILCFFVGQSLPNPFQPVINIVFKSIVVGLVYSALVFGFKISDEINDIIYNSFNKLKHILQR